MPPVDAVAAVWMMGLSHTLGVIAAVMCRRCAGSPMEAACQRVYLGLLAVAGVVTMVSLYVGPLAWILSATTLAVMILLATYDCGPDRDLVPANRAG